MIISCSKRLEFDAAHRVVGHDSGCQLLHGHRYGVEFTFKADQLDQLGMVIDFKEIKNRFKNWIDKNWDHNTILNRSDQELGEKIASYTGQKIFYLDYNPTAENLAFYLGTEVLREVFSDAKHYITALESVKLLETPTSSAIFYPNPDKKIL
jgi:6-pyruvoyltetrahydropterin/6-carboxytetrahydropterin synthase